MTSQNGLFGGPSFEGPDTVEDDDTLSRGSQSVGSGFTGGDGPITYRDLVDLTSPSKCRVLLGQGQKQRVCGQDRDTCTRRYHQENF